jgi:uncharacterized coiled-coil protein SlyX
MSSASSLRLTLAMVTASVLLPCFTITRAQESSSEQDQAIVEAARKAREKKKSEKPIKVIDEDALKPAPGPLNPPDLQTAAASVPTVRGQAQPAAETASSDQKNDQKNGQKTDQKEEAKRLAAEVAKAKEKLAELEKQQDLLQRQFALDRDTVYSNPDYANDAAGLAKLDALQQQINEKQQAVNDAKAHLAELQSKLDQVAPSETPAQPEPAPPQP